MGNYLRIIRVALFIMAGFFVGSTAFAADQKQEDAIPPLPAAQKVSNPLLLMPDKPALCFYLPNVPEAGKKWAESLTGKFFSEARIVNVIRNNPFDFVTLLSDLPSVFVSQDRVKLLSMGADMAKVIASTASQVAFAVYSNADGSPGFLFLAEIGVERQATLDRMDALTEELSVVWPRLDSRIEGDLLANGYHVWGDRESPCGEMAAGIVRNFLFISSRVDLANNVIALSDGGASLGGAEDGLVLLREGGVSPAPAVVGVVHSAEIGSKLVDNDAAKGVLSVFGDILGKGRGDAPFYYRLAFDEYGVKESYLCPVPSSGELLAPLSDRLRVNYGEWTTINALPYNPAPLFVASINAEPGALANWLLLDPTSSLDSPWTRTLAPSMNLRLALVDEVKKYLAGEMTIAWFGAENEKSKWVLVLALEPNSSSAIPKGNGGGDVNGMAVNSTHVEWKKNMSWMFFPVEMSRRLKRDLFLVASDGEVLSLVASQLVSGTPFTENKDFSSMFSRSTGSGSIMFYFNLQELLVREYSYLASFMREVFPRSSGLNDRPPLTLLRNYATGFLGFVEPAAGADGWLVNVQGSFPSAALGAGAVLAKMPGAIRSQSRAYIEQSEENLRKMWLIVQLYFTRRGHFPFSLEDLANDMRRTMAEADVRALLTSPAAMHKYGKQDAWQRSYKFITGLVPGDEPDLPILYESEPWTEDFSGMFPVKEGQVPREIGSFLPYRAYVAMDGTVHVISEKVFQDKMVPRLKARE